MKQRVLQVLLYSSGPFFSFPWKPIIHVISGSGNYSTALRHFRTQHQNKYNLAWHVVCLVYQLLANFILLAEIDVALADQLQYQSSIGWFSVLTFVLWCSTLAYPSDCPIHIQLISIAAILLAYYNSDRWTIQMVEISAYVAFATIYAVGSSSKLSKISLSKEALLVLSLLLCKLVVCYILSLYWRGALSQYTNELVVLYVIGMIAVCSLKDPVKLSVFYGAFVGSVLGTLLNQQLLISTSSAFVATAMQGLAHSLSGEQATLVMLQDSRTGAAKLAYEWSHVVYFPNLLIHTIFLRANLLDDRPM